MEYPFFVQDRGWSSCCPQKTTQLYGLTCRQLIEGDVCLALTPTPPATPTQTHRTHTRTGSRAHRAQLHPSRAAGQSGSSHREEMPPPPPPPPLPHHPPPTVPAPQRAVEPPAREQPRPRKRRWSAPDTFHSTGTGESLLDLPHGSKLTKRQ